MKEKERNLFFNTSALTETKGLRSRANAGYIEGELKRRFPGEALSVRSISINESGVYKRALGSIRGLPPYCEVVVAHCTGKRTAEVIVWSPLAWNGRFWGTGGGGTATGGRGYITPPDNTSRGGTLPKAVLNGFTAATTDAGNPERFWALDGSGKRDWERLENWHSRGTHYMTQVGRAVAEILHDRPVEYSYYHGGSGGGRQGMVEAQEWPRDYDGVWVSCPAINWTKFLLQGLWPIAVMNTLDHRLSAKNIRRFMEAAQGSVGGWDAYYRRGEAVEFDPYTLVGTDGISKADAEVMRRIWDGPRRANGERLWYAHRPGVLFWNVGIPVGAFYYSLIGHKPKPFILSADYGHWVTEEPKRRFDGITVEEYVELFDKGMAELGRFTADDPDLRPFADGGGKLLIDHGTDDPLIPVDGTLDYYRRMCEAVGGKTEADRFCRLYITPGDGHGACNWHGPGLTETEGMRALMAWVERGEAPGRLETVQVDKKGGTIGKGEAFPQ